MNIIAWIVLGIAAGWLAGLIAKSDHGIVGDLILGIIGALVGGFIFNLLGASGVNGLNLYSLVVATFGAIVLIWLGRMVQR